jgi:parvulin-like peptidyl-prolyl isomerase
MPPVDPKLKNVIIARINNAVITEFDVSCGLELAYEPHRDTKGKVRLMQNEQYELRQAVIDRLITRELLYQEGVRRGTDVSPVEFENALRVSMQEFQSEEHFAAVLALQGQTLEDYKEQLKHDLITNKVAAAVVEGRRREVTDADARAYYDKNRSHMQGPEMRHILLIELALDRYAEPARVTAAQAQLEPCTRGPEAFMEVFESKKTPAGISCRDLGFITRGQYHPLLDSVAFRMGSGQVSRIVRTEESLNVLYVKTVLAEGHIWPFEDVAENLRKSIYEMQSVEMINDFVKQLRQSSSVAVYDTATQQRLDMEK